MHKQRKSSEYVLRFLDNGSKSRAHTFQATLSTPATDKIIQWICEEASFPLPPWIGTTGLFHFALSGAPGYLSESLTAHLILFFYILKLILYFFFSFSGVP